MGITNYNNFKILKFSSNILGFLCILLFILLTKYKLNETYIYILLLVCTGATFCLTIYLLYEYFNTPAIRKESKKGTKTELLIRLLIPILLIFYFLSSSK